MRTYNYRVRIRRVGEGCHLEWSAGSRYEKTARRIARIESLAEGVEATVYRISRVDDALLPIGTYREGEEAGP